MWLAIGRRDIPRARQHHYIAWVRAAAAFPCPASRVLEVRERIGAGGTGRRGARRGERAGGGRRLPQAQGRGGGGLPAAFLRNPAHERRVAELAARQPARIAVTASCDVLPVVREYERSLATVLNALVMPGVATYVLAAGGSPGRGECRRAAAYMQSNGGVARWRHHPAGAGADGAVGPPQRVWSGAARRRRLRVASGTSSTVDIGGTMRRHLPDQERPDRAHPARPCR